MEVRVVAELALRRRTLSMSMSNTGAWILLGILGDGLVSGILMPTCFWIYLLTYLLYVCMYVG